MSLKAMIPTLLEEWKQSAETIEHNETLFDIYEGDLLSYVVDDLRASLSEKSFHHIKDRIAPINVLKRLIDKSSKIYVRSPIREIDGGSESDQKVLDYYHTSMEINTQMALANEFFNLHKSCALEPFLDRGVPKLRILPAGRFIVYSADSVNPLRVTHFAKIMGKRQIGNVERMTFYGYSDDEFLAFDEEGELVEAIMSRPEVASLGGKNPVGRIPFVYINRSRHDLVPVIDTDTLAMTKLIPVLLADLNYAVKFQCFSIIYGINVSAEGLEMAPNAYWHLKSDPKTDKDPEVGVIKPQVDIEQVLGLIKSQLAFWMQTRGIRPGSIGDLSPENASSGISKMIDEMDTSEDRAKQVPYFINAEVELFELIKALHEVWRVSPEFGMKGTSISPNTKAKITFADQRPIVDSTKVIDDQDRMIQMGIQSKAGALKDIYPDWTDKQVEERLKLVNEEQAKSKAQEEPMAEQVLPEQEAEMGAQ